MIREEWLLIAEDSGRDGNGRVLSYMVFDTEREAHVYDGRRGALCDDMGLFIDEDIPDDFCVEIMTYDDYKSCYGLKMPLRNQIQITY
jgi:hypothetical protein